METHLQHTAIILPQAQCGRRSLALCFTFACVQFEQSTAITRDSERLGGSQLVETLLLCQMSASTQSADNYELCANGKRAMHVCAQDASTVRTASHPKLHWQYGHGKRGVEVTPGACDLVSCARC